MDFRPMRREDCSAVNSIRNSSREWLHDPREFSVQETYRWFDADFDDDGGESQSSYFVITNYDQVIGYFRIENDSYDMEGVWIGADLHPDWRGKRLMKGLYIEFMHTLIRMFDIQTFYLEVLEFNIPARKLYDSLGFKEVGETLLDRTVEVEVDQYSQEINKTTIVKSVKMVMTAQKFKELYLE